MAQGIDVDHASRIRRKSKNPHGTQTVTGGGTTTDASEREDVSSDLSSGKAARGGGAGMPKQEPGEDPAAYGERLRKWRASAANQAKALGAK